jgi:hypothetical protein
MPEPLMIRGRPSRSAAVALLAAEGLPVADLIDASLGTWDIGALIGRKRRRRSNRLASLQAIARRIRHS